MNKSLKKANFPFSKEFVQVLFKANFTAAEWRIWIYVMAINSTGEECSINSETLQKECRVSRSTMHRALSRLASLGLLEKRRLDTVTFSFPSDEQTEGDKL